MAYWLLKTEPGEYSFDRLLTDGRTVWDGITNPVALKHLRTAAPGDRLVIYHTGGERRAVGTAEIVGGPHDDTRAGAPKIPVIEIEARDRLPVPVELQALKADKLFDDSPLVRQGRLSFVPLTDAQWARLMVLARKGRAAPKGRVKK